MGKNRDTSNSQPRAPTLGPCRFCGETIHLEIDRDGLERVAIVDGKVADVVCTAGKTTGMEHVDAVNCQVCDASAPLDVWNGTRPESDFALLRDFDPEPSAAAPHPARR